MGKRPVFLKWVLAFVILAGSAGAAVAQPLISQREFRDRVAAQVARDQPQAKVQRDGEAGLSVTAPGDEPMIQSMDRAYSLYRAEPSRLSALIQDFAASFRPVAITPQALRILVRRASANPPPGPGGPADRGLVRPIAGDLMAIVAVDAPDAYKFLRASILHARLKMDDAAIWARAQANTRALIPIQPRPLVAGQPARLEAEGLSSSLLADDAFWNARPMIASGPVVVAAPGRDEIYIVALSDTRMVQALRQEMAKVANDADTLFPRLLVRRAGRWELLP